MSLNEKLKEVLGWPAIIAGCLISIAGILTFFGFSLKSPAEEINDTIAIHVVEEKGYHNFQLNNDQLLSQMLDSLRQAIGGLSQHVEHLEKKQDAALRGECLENPREQLSLQGLINECRRLGIEPQR